MTGTLDLSALSVVFVSYDEPEADTHFAALLTVVPHAHRVHGLRGFDTAHRMAGAVARSDHVITVDADNRIAEPDFFARRYAFSASERASVIAFGARVAHNGLVYGNGGIKIWPRTMLRTLRTHEYARDGGTSVDFAGQLPYVQAQDVPSQTVVTATPRQAFRSGYREGARLALADRLLPHQAFPGLAPAEALRRHVAKSNLERLRVWCTVGRDTPNGAWAILGARLGCIDANLDRKPLANITDYGWLDTLWQSELAGIDQSDEAFAVRMEDARARLDTELALGIEDLDAAASARFKADYVPRRRIGALWTAPMASPSRRTS